jgi:hypothetical protein
VRRNEGGGIDVWDGYGGECGLVILIADRHGTHGRTETP